MTWQPAEFGDIDAMIRLTQQSFTAFNPNIVRPDMARLAAQVAHAIVRQHFNPAMASIRVIRSAGSISAWTWIEPTTTDFFADPVVEAHMLQVNDALSARTRVATVQSALTDMTAWCRAAGYQYLVSTTIRPDWQSFMRIHAKMGFATYGSHAILHIGK